VPFADPSAFAQQLRKAAEGRTNPIVVINADAQAPHQAVIGVMEAARLAGLARVSFAAQKPRE
jgi:biopolymer transport protein ExbD